MHPVKRIDKLLLREQGFAFQLKHLHIGKTLPDLLQKLSGKISGDIDDHIVHFQVLRAHQLTDHLEKQRFLIGHHNLPFFLLLSLVYKAAADHLSDIFPAILSADGFRLQLKYVRNKLYNRLLQRVDLFIMRKFIPLAHLFPRNCQIFRLRVRYQPADADAEKMAHGFLRIIRFHQLLLQRNKRGILKIVVQAFMYLQIRVIDGPHVCFLMLKMLDRVIF